MSLARESGNRLGKTLRDASLGFNHDGKQPLCDSAEGLNNCEGMLHMLTDIYAKVALLAHESAETPKHVAAWTAGFMNGMQYQLQRMIRLLLEILNNRPLPKRFRVCANPAGTATRNSG
jgi:hypothetical protein